MEQPVKEEVIVKHKSRFLQQYFVVVVLWKFIEKARLFYHELHPDKSEDDFKASSGWLHRFKKRHGIRKLIMQGESLSADTGTAEEFKTLLHEFVEEHT